MIRRAVDADIPALDRLLFQVHQVHHEARSGFVQGGREEVYRRAIEGDSGG